MSKYRVVINSINAATEFI